MGLVEERGVRVPLSEVPSELVGQRGERVIEVSNNNKHITA